MFILAVFSMYHAADARAKHPECKMGLDPCTLHVKGDGICTQRGSCQLFRDADLSRFDAHKFKTFAPRLVQEAEKWQQGKALNTIDTQISSTKISNQSEYFLSASLVKSILTKANEKIQAENSWWSSPLVELTTPPKGKIVLLGDTHGQLKDLLWIFQKHGLPSTSVVYLMNGDICDRGRDAVTIWVLLLVYKLSNEAVIHINRGNHEDRRMTQFYGFAQELKTKFDRNFEPDISALFHSIFNTLPLYTIINNEMFVVHGGLPRVDAARLTKQQLAQVNHVRGYPESLQDTSDEIFTDALWADPQEKNGITIGTPRGSKESAFGPNVTKSFLKVMNLKRVIRSHQPKNTPQWAGLESFHSGKGITVFSASNYYLKEGDVGNRAAVLILTRKTGRTRTNIRVTQHYIENDEAFNVAEKDYNKLMTWEGPLQDFFKVESGLQKSEPKKSRLESFLTFNKNKQ